MGLLDRFRRPAPPPVIITREPNPRRARPRRLSPTALAPATLRPAEVTLSEAVFSAVSGDPDAAHTAAQMGSAYVRRLTAQAERTLPRLTEDRGREVAWWLYETNPLAKRVIELTRDYIIADGVAVTVPVDRDDAERPLAEPAPPPEQAVIDAFWSDPVNRMDRRLDALVTELAIFGDQFLTVAVNPVNGAVRLGMIDPGNVAEVIHDPLRPDEPMVVLVSPTAGPQGATGADRIPFKVVRRDDDPRSPSYGRLVGVRRDGTGAPVDRFAYGDGAPPIEYAGSCFVWSVNKISTATRGKSDLFTLADWLDSLDQVLFGEVDRQLLSKAYVWDVTLTGMDATGIQEWLKLNGGTPKPGSFRAHNEKVAYAVVSPDLKTYDTGKAVDLFKDVVSAGGGIPKTWLSGTMDVNKATATELAEPAFKRLTRRQRLIREYLSDLITFVLDQAELASRLPRRPAGDGGLPDPWRFTIAMPELRPKDLKLAADTFAAAMQALAAARAEEAIDLDVAQEVVRLLVEQFGVEVDLDAMRQRLEQERAAHRAEMAAMRPPMGQVPDPGAADAGDAADAGGPANETGQQPGEGE